MLNVIIPAYNCSTTLPKTLASLVAQTYRSKFVVTIVDDCSTEDLEPIVNYYKEYLVIKYLKLSENHGVGYARQYGINNSPEFCKYIMFVDSDDMLMPYTIEWMVREIRQNSPEVIVSNFISNTRENLNVMDKKTATWTHGKCYSKDFLKKFDIRVPNLRMNEDAGFNTMVFELSTNINKIEEITYFWECNLKSLTRSDKDFFIKCLPGYITSHNIAFQTISKHKSLRECKRLGRTLCSIYYYYQMILFHKAFNLKEIKVEIKKFFKDNNLKENYDSNIIQQEINVHLNRAEVECHLGPYRCLQTFDDFIKEFIDE